MKTLGVRTDWCMVRDTWTAAGRASPGGTEVRAKAPRNGKNGGQDKRDGTVVPSNPRLHRGRRGTVPHGTSAAIIAHATAAALRGSAVCASARCDALGYQP